MELQDVNLEELEKRHKRERDGKIKERLHYLLLLKEGYTDRGIKKICHTSRSSVSFWHCRFRVFIFDRATWHKNNLVVGYKTANTTHDTIKELRTSLKSFWDKQIRFFLYKYVTPHRD